MGNTSTHLLVCAAGLLPSLGPDTEREDDEGQGADQQDDDAHGLDGTGFNHVDNLDTAVRGALLHRAEELRGVDLNTDEERETHDGRDKAQDEYQPAEDQGVGRSDGGILGTGGQGVGGDDGILGAGSQLRDGQHEEGVGEGEEEASKGVESLKSLYELGKGLGAPVGLEVRKVEGVCDDAEEEATVDEVSPLSAPQNRAGLDLQEVKRECDVVPRDAFADSVSPASNKAEGNDAEDQHGQEHDSLEPDVDGECVHLLECHFLDVEEAVKLKIG